MKLERASYRLAIAHGGRPDFAETLFAYLPPFKAQANLMD